MPDYLSVSEIDLELYIQSKLLAPEEEITMTSGSLLLTAGMKKAWLSPKAIPLLTYLLDILPSFLKAKFGVAFDKTLTNKVIGTKEHYNQVLEPFLTELEEYGYQNVDDLRNRLAFQHLPFSADTRNKLVHAIYTLRTKIKQSLTPDAWEVLRTIFSAMASEELNTDSILYLKEKAKYIPNKLLGRYIASINPSIEASDLQKELEVARKSVKDITEKYFKTSTPRAEELKVFQTKYPDKYREYNKAVQSVKKAAKKVVEEAFKKNDYDIIDVEEAKRLLLQLGIPNPIDDGFVGKVGIGTTPSMIFRYYTIYGKLLDAIVGRNVTMNPKYTEKDNTYYCTHVPFITEKAKPIKIYSYDHTKGSKEKLFNALHDCLPVLDDVRTQFSEAVKPILNGRITANALAFAVLRVMDETAGRIGNADSVREQETFGIHNLQVRHATIKKNSVILKYIGKKKIPQEHKVEDPVSVSIIKTLCKDKKKDDYIFSETGERPVGPTTISENLKKTGFPASPHMFRKIWAAKLFNERALRNKELKNIKTEKQAKEFFKEVVGVVAAKLGQTELATSINSYIDPTLMKTYWDKVGFKMPANVQKAWDKMSGQSPDDGEE